MPNRTKSSRKINQQRRHRATASPTYVTISKWGGLKKLIIPGNRAARRAYMKQNGHETMLPPMVMPMTKVSNE